MTTKRTHHATTAAIEKDKNKENPADKKENKAHNTSENPHAEPPQLQDRIDESGRHIEQNAASQGLQAMHQERHAPDRSQGFIQLTSKQIMLVHKVIHKLVEPCRGVQIGGRQYMVFLHTNGSRAITIGDTIWIAQNEQKESRHSDFAQTGREYTWADGTKTTGHKITWGMRDTGSWVQVFDDNVIYQGAGSRQFGPADNPPNSAWSR